MKIISKFRDYYDSISHQYLDKEIIYLREQREIPIEREMAPPLGLINLDEKGHESIRNRRWEVSFEIIGFCGRNFPVVGIYDYQSEDRNCAYTYPAMQRLLDELSIPVARKTMRWLGGLKRLGYAHALDEYRAFFEDSANLKGLDRYYFDLNAPCFVIRRNQDHTFLISNPPLGKYGFASQVDPFLAHQELYMFVAGRLHQPVRPMVEISDVDKVHKHGFNKWSFRRHKDEGKSGKD